MIPNEWMTRKTRPMSRTNLARRTRAPRVLGEKCDCQEPCSSCVKTKSECIYSAPTMLSRRRKRHDAQEDVFARLQRYEELLRKNNIDYTPPNKDSWIHFVVEVNNQQSNASTPRLSNEAKAPSRPPTRESGEA